MSEGEEASPFAKAVVVVCGLAIGTTAFLLFVRVFTLAAW